MTADPVVALPDVQPDVPNLPAALDGNDLAQLMELARVLAKSELIPKPLRGKPQDVLLVILTAREVGIGPIQALNGIDVIDGRSAMSAELMRALVQRAGHTIIVRSDERSAVCSGTRRDTGASAEFEFTHDDAVMAGLTNKVNWRLYPKAMLAARATSGLCRNLFADVIAGVSYVPEELEVAVAERVPDTPPQSASEILAVALQGVAEATSADEARAVWSAAVPHLNLPEKAQLHAAMTARKDELLAAETESAPAAGGGQAGADSSDDVVDADVVVEEPQLPVWGDPNYVGEPEHSAGVDGPPPAPAEPRPRRKPTKPVPTGGLT